ncbi:DUF5079 family protein [Staphylococcus agnetis]|uniref:DUF5079 domain-containing protein n=1 Tax=Staphylococcus agnetis TaxID=985762 RepID=A0ABX3Z3G8_9STAP|nr:DUF5079 family protein [Staphylococcus agnetis]ALN77769.1 DUF5079 family protein [Staphylococcus agnetis]OSP20279.1 DUF5079 domain-containing protein [Staphylococcus agnetis]OSP22995.1 DUF5079 domain-containing protein [Staphylococcus agnetis]OTW31466.1 DUF5079 domain-containing protein [Staphylococcus agnetis]
MLETYITNLKKSHMKPFIIFLMILVLFFNTLMIYGTNAWNKIPIYLYVTYAVWVVFSLILFKQDRFENVKVDELSALRYLTINIIAGYIQPIAVASCYLIGIAFTPWNGITYWFQIIGAVMLSVLAITLFSINEFHLLVKNAKGTLNFIAILIKLVSLGWIAYLAKTVPVTAEENGFIWISILFLLCIDLLILRSFFNYGLVVRTLNGDFEQPGNSSISEE